MFKYNSRFVIFLMFLCNVSSDFNQIFVIEKLQEWKMQIDKGLVKNEKCGDQLKQLFSVIFDGGGFRDNWAWKMLDSANKINAGILTGNTIGPGNMQECLDIDEIHNGMGIKGKYCYAAINIPLPVKKENRIRQLSNRISVVNMPGYYSAAICIPHECSMLDFVPEIGFDPCQTKDTLSDWDNGDWAFIIFLLIMAVLILFSTTYDWYIRYSTKEPVYPILMAFSFYTNSEKLLKISNSPDQISSLNGIRALSMMWVMIGHRYSASLGAPIVNLEQAKEWIEKPYSQYVQGAPVAVDSFFFLTGVLLAYGFMKCQSKPKARFNIILFYIHRYVRLTPAAAVLYFYYVTVFKHITTGPLWPLVSNFEAENCKNNAMSYFLYIQNIINPEMQCMGHTWYLSVDFQIFLVSPIILLPMVKYPKYAGYAMIGLISISILPPTLITYFMDILYYGENFMKHYYAQPYTRISPWLVGVLLGYLFYQMRNIKVKINWIVNLCIWILVLATMLFILYIGNKMLFSEEIWKLALYNGFHRLFWALGLMWIVFSCQNGYGGFVNWFLSLPIFQVIGRISYSMYLLHVSIQIISIYRKKTPFFFDDYELLNQALGDILAISFIAFFYCMMFESPMIVIEKVIFAPNGYIVRGMNWIMVKILKFKKTYICTCLETAS